MLLGHLKQNLPHHTNLLLVLMPDTQISYAGFIFLRRKPSSFFMGIGTIF